MGSMNISLKKILSALCKVGDCLSYVWFLFPVVIYFCYVETTKIMMDDPIKTDFYLGILEWTLLLYIIATIFLLHRRKTVQFCIAVVVGYIIIFAFALLGIGLQSAPTRFSLEHSIPEGLEYYTPKADSVDLATDVDSLDQTTYLQVRNSYQGGIYEYSFYYPSLPEGTIWLQCYEVTENYPLSKSRIRKKSTEHVRGTDHFACLVDCKEFTIYEGDWNKYYAARIEVWFKDKKGNKRKLLEKVYAVEGWMR